MILLLLKVTLLFAIVTVQAQKWRDEKSLKNVEFGPGLLVQNLAM